MSTPVPNKKAFDDVLHVNNYRSQKLSVRKVVENNTTGGHSGEIVYFEPDDGHLCHPIFRFDEEVMVIKPGMEPRDGKFFQNDQGEWKVRQERPDWAPKESKGWTVRVSMEDGGQLFSFMSRITLSLAQQFAKAKNVNIKKVTVQDKLEKIGEFSTVAIQEWRIRDQCIMYDGDDLSSGGSVDMFADYPLNPRDTLKAYCLQPLFPWLREDKNQKGHYIFSVNWLLRSACIGEPRPEKAPLTEEEKAANERALFDKAMIRTPLVKEDKDLVELAEMEVVTPERPVKRRLEFQEPAPDAPLKKKNKN